MTFDQAAIVAIFGVALVLFISERVRYDLVALGTLLAAVLLGLVKAEDAFNGFGNNAVVTVAAVLVMSHGLARSGAVDVVSGPLLRQAKHPLVLMAGLCIVGAFLSAFMNNVGALALLMPVAMVGARAGGYSVSLLLMPLSFATLLGGMTTLIGTPPNLLVSDLALRLRGEKFAMFDFAPVGIAITLAAIAFIVLVGWRLLPNARTGRKAPDEMFDVGHYVTEARLTELGLPNFAQPIAASCADHGGPGSAMILQWDAGAKTWGAVSDWITADADVVDPLIAEDSAAFAKESGITERCN